MVLSRGLKWQKGWRCGGLSPSKHAVRRPEEAFAQACAVADVEHQYHKHVDIGLRRVSQGGIAEVCGVHAIYDFLLRSGGCATLIIESSKGRA